MLKIMVLSLVLVVSGAGVVEASFLDDFENPGLVDYNDSNSHGQGGSFEISGGKLNITTGNDNTFSVMTTDTVEFAIGATLSLEVPARSGYEGVFMMCSTTAGQPDPNGAGTFGFRFRRDGNAYARMHLYPGGILADTRDRDPSKPATLSVKRTSDTNFDYSITIEGVETTLGSFVLSQLSGITDLHIGAQAYDLWTNTFSFDNLQVYNCEGYFIDHFDDYDPNFYTFEDSWGSGGKFEISGGRLNITTGKYNTASVMTTDWVAFCVGETLRLEVPPVSTDQGVFMMCSTTAGQPDGNTTFGFRFRRDEYDRMHVYPSDTTTSTLDPDPSQPATLCVKRISDTGFDYSIMIEGNETALDSFTLNQLSGVTNLHIGAQAYAWEENTFSFDNLRLDRCGNWGYHSMDFNRDCYVNSLDFAMFAGSWLECTMPGEPDCEDLFSIVILPDTQKWSEEEPDTFNAAAKWIVANKETKNIKFVLHVGDIVEHDAVTDEWVNAKTAMSILDGKVPYCFGVGNHDMKEDPNKQGYPDPSRDTTNFNNTFPYTRYEGESWYGGRMLDDIFPPADNYDNTYHFFSACGMDFMIVCLSVAPNDVHLDWANYIVSSYEDRRVIVVTHAYLDYDELLDANSPWIVYSPDGGNNGEQIWHKFIKEHENIFFVACGHLNNGRLTSTGDNGNLVHQTVNNNKLLRILRFVPEDNMIYVSSYDPLAKNYNTNPDNQYEFHYDMK